MLFLALSNADIQFDIKSFTRKSYSVAEVLPKARRLELIDKHKFTKVALNKILKHLLCI